LKIDGEDENEKMVSLSPDIALETEEELSYQSRRTSLSQSTQEVELLSLGELMELPEPQNPVPIDQDIQKDDESFELAEYPEPIGVPLKSGEE